MSAGKRGKEAFIMLALWCTIPLAALICDAHVEETFFLWFSVIYTAIFFFSGLPIFMGHIFLLAGFNTMSSKERKKYDTEKICRFVGIGMFVMATVTFYASLALMMTGNESSLILVLLVLPVAGTLAMVALLNGKRFKRDAPIWEKSATDDKTEKIPMKLLAGISIVATVGAVIGIILLVVSGSVNASMDDDRLHVKAPMMNRTIDYADIVSVEFRESFEKGIRTNGFGGSNISSGNFRNTEFGNYDLAANRGMNAYIVIEPREGKMLVFNLESVEKTVEFYDGLVDKIGLPP